jgi:hypothetical protein
MGFIGRDELLDLARPLGTSDYGRYLHHVAESES